MQQLDYECLSRRGNACRVISQFAVLATRTPGIKVVIYCRESCCANIAHLRDQEAFLRELVENLGGIVVTAVREQFCGWTVEWLPKRRGFARAISIAKKTGAVVLAESTDRFARSRVYHSVSNPHPKLSKTANALYTEYTYRWAFRDRPSFPHLYIAAYIADNFFDVEMKTFENQRLHAFEQKLLAEYHAEFGRAVGRWPVMNKPPRSRYAIWKATGIDQATLSKFVNRKCMLSMESLDALGELLNLKLTTHQEKGRGNG